MIFEKLHGLLLCIVFSYYFLLGLPIISLCFSWKVVRKKFEAFFNYSQIVNIKINLGQENLKEEDILRLIAKSIHEQYKIINRPISSARRLLWSIISFFVFYVIALILFYYNPTYDIANEIRRDYCINEFFPSQNIFSKDLEVTYHLDMNFVEIIEKVQIWDENFSIFDYSNLIYNYAPNPDSLSEKVIEKLKERTPNKNAKDVSFHRYFESLNLAIDSIPTNTDTQKFLDAQQQVLLDYTKRFVVDTLKWKSENVLNKVSIDSSISNLTNRLFSHNQGSKDFILTENDLKLYFSNWMVGGDSIKFDKKAQNYICSTSSLKDTISTGWIKNLHRLDYFTYTLYTEVSHFVVEAFLFLFEDILKDSGNPEVKIFNASLDLNENLHIVPPRLDYLFLIFFLILWTFWRLFLRLRIFGVKHNMILKELSNLVDSIDSSITKSRDGKIGIFEKVGLAFSSRKIYPIAGAREIENKLINILNLSQKIPFFRMCPKFVFVFDELDKIEPTGTYASTDSETQTPFDEYVTEGSKKRQDAIGRILSNLKHFFNTAKAKFIFIAGREMYDAALADISDRDSLIGSLFHDVIYVPSFYKDPADGKLSDITSMTEQYVCQFLLPADYLKPSLKTYREYLEKEFKFSPNELVKIIVTLQNFINYLTYRTIVRGKIDAKK